MLEVGVRELKAGISAYLRRVAEGEHVRVTHRGRPLADLVPAGQSSSEERWRQLVAEGAITPARRAWPKRPPPAQRARGSATAEVLAEREDER